MQQLADLQQYFCDALRSSETPPQDLLDQLVDDGLALQRFNIYRNNFIVLNGDALADMYPVIKQLVGDEAFRYLATRYVRMHPPQERSLLLYGDQFTGFIATIPALATLPYLPDIARLEFAWTRAYHAEECPLLTQQQVATITPEAFGLVQLTPHPSLHCIRSDYPIYRIWQANQSPDTEEPISLQEGTSNVLVIRSGPEVEVREVSTGEFHLMQDLQSGNTLDAAVSRALAVDERFDLSNFFAHHLFDGTFCSLQPAADSTALKQ